MTRGRRTRDWNWRQYLERGEELGWVLLLKLVFLGVLALLIVASAAVSHVGLAVLIALVAGAMLKSIVPYDEFRQWSDDVWHGDVSVSIRSRVSGGWNRLKGVFSR
jgi:hypothetical protein